MTPEDAFPDRDRLPSLVPYGAADSVCLYIAAHIGEIRRRQEFLVSWTCARVRVKLSYGIATGSPSGEGAVRYLMLNLLAGASESRTSYYNSAWNASLLSTST